jgi:hypothetical protein
MKLQRNFPLLVLHMYTLNCTTFLYTKLSLHIQTHYANKGQQQLMHKRREHKRRVGQCWTKLPCFLIAAAKGKKQ